MDYNESFQWFLDGILTYRSERDADSSPETWLSRRLSALFDTDNDGDWKAYLSLSMKLADLLDDRKRWLLNDIREDFTEILSNEDSILC